MEYLNPKRYIIYLISTGLLFGTVMLFIERERYKRIYGNDPMSARTVNIYTAKERENIPVAGVPEASLVKDPSPVRVQNTTAARAKDSMVAPVRDIAPVYVQNTTPERAKDTVALEKSGIVPPVIQGDNPCSHMVKQRNILFAISALLLTISLVLGSVMIVQSQGRQASTGEQNLTRTMPASGLAFEKGVIFPHFIPDAYGNKDVAWQQGIKDMKTQTSAQWIEIPILFSQASNSDTHVELSSSAPNVATFIQGVRAAHAAGYKVFFAPLITVRTPDGWSGVIDLPTSQLQRAWFDSYWNAIKPYAQAAQANKVEQMAVATELQILQTQVPAEYWNQLLTRVASVFTSTRTYDMNWSSLALPMPSWLSNPLFEIIGVSSYIALTDVNQPVPVAQIPQLWQERIKNPLDKLSIQFNKKVLITEIGYRNTSDSLYETWLKSTSAPADPQLQAQAYDAALLNVFKDPNIRGIFFWGWDNADQYTFKGQPAVQVLQHWYSQYS